MPVRVQVRRHSERPAETAPETTSKQVPAGHMDATAKLDALLDEIDVVLDANAEEFVRTYVQRGGQ